MESFCACFECDEFQAVAENVHHRLEILCLFGFIFYTFVVIGNFPYKGISQLIASPECSNTFPNAAAKSPYAFSYTYDGCY